MAETAGEKIDFIESWSEAERVLMSESFKSNRLDSWLNAYTGSQQEAVNEIYQFLSSWPMFMDGAEHRRVRGYLKKTIAGSYGLAVSDALDLARRLAAQNLITGESIQALAIEWHRRYFQLNEDEARIIKSLAAEIDQLFASDVNGDWSPIRMVTALRYAREAIENVVSRSEGPVGRLHANGGSIDLCMTIVVDTISSLPLSLASLIHFMYGRPEASGTLLPRQVVQSSLFENPPFRFIGRLKVGSFEEAVERVAVDIIACHADIGTELGSAYSRSLVFGMGKHFCLGATLVVEFLGAVCSVLRDSWRNRSVHYRYDSIDRSGGRCEIKGIFISID